MAEAAVAFPDIRFPLEGGRNPLLAHAQQEVKSAVHRELIDKADLEKLLYMQDSRGRQFSRSALSISSASAANFTSCWACASKGLRPPSSGNRMSGNATAGG